MIGVAKVDTSERTTRMSINSVIRWEFPAGPVVKTLFPI